MLPVGDREGGLLDRLRHVGVETPSSALTRAAAALIRARAWMCAGSSVVAGDGEVLDRALRLRPPQRVTRHADLAHRVVLDPVRLVTHAPTVRPFNHLLPLSRRLWPVEPQVVAR